MESNNISKTIALPKQCASSDFLEIKHQKCDKCYMNKQVDHLKDHLKDKSSQRRRKYIEGMLVQKQNLHTIKFSLTARTEFKISKTERLTSVSMQGLMIQRQNLFVDSFVGSNCM